MRQAGYRLLVFVTLLAAEKSFLLRCRRDYSGLFDAVANTKELTSAPHFTLRLIGRGDLTVPAALHGRVTMETDLPYEVLSE